MTSTAPEAVRRGRRQLLALAALFFVPLAIAFWMYYGPTDWRPSGDASKGDLIEPARPLAEIALTTMDGEATAPSLLRGKWTMLYVGDGLCDDRCRKALYLTRQSRIALNKDMDRVQRVFLVTGRCCDRGFLATEHPDLVVASWRTPPRPRCSSRSRPTTACRSPARAASTWWTRSATC
jgi:hypothetical protein